MEMEREETKLAEKSGFYYDANFYCCRHVRSCSILLSCRATYRPDYWLHVRRVADEMRGIQIEIERAEG